MRLLQLSLLLTAFCLSGCIYYPTPYYPPQRVYYIHRHHPRQQQDQNLDQPSDAPDNPRVGPDDRDRDEPGPPRLKGQPDLDPESSPPPAPSKPINSKDVPTAARGSKPGLVRNPFQPEHEIDVSGMQSGALAKDPTTGKVFRVP